MRVLVTGGAGYVGSFTVHRLLAAGHDVHVIDDLSSGHAEAIPGVPLTTADVGDAQALDRCMARFSPAAVMHFAALKVPADSLRDPGRYFAANTAATVGVLEAMVRHGCRVLVFSSSSAVYGMPHVFPVDEACPCRPASPYAETKLQGERMIHYFAAAYDLSFACLRYFNAAGAALDHSRGEHPGAYGQLVPAAVRAALSPAGKLTIFGTDYPTTDGTAVRDFVHVEDLAVAHVQMLECLRAEGCSGVYNVGSGTPITVLGLVRQLERITGQEIPVEFRARRPGDPPVSWADPRRITELLGWAPAYGIADILRSAWRWHAAYPRTLGLDLEGGAACTSSC